MDYSIRKTQLVYTKCITNSIDELADYRGVEPISAKGLKSADEGKNTDDDTNYPVNCGEETGNTLDRGKPRPEDNRRKRGYKTEYKHLNHAFPYKGIGIKHEQYYSNQYGDWRKPRPNMSAVKNTRYQAQKEHNRRKLFCADHGNQTRFSVVHKIHPPCSKYSMR